MNNYLRRPSTISFALDWLLQQATPIGQPRRRRLLSGHRLTGAAIRSDVDHKLAMRGCGRNRCVIS